MPRSKRKEVQRKKIDEFLALQNRIRLNACKYRKCPLKEEFCLSMANMYHVQGEFWEG